MVEKKTTSKKETLIEKPAPKTKPGTQKSGQSFSFSGKDILTLLIGLVAGALIMFALTPQSQTTNTDSNTPPSPPIENELMAVTAKEAGGILIQFIRDNADSFRLPEGADISVDATHTTQSSNLHQIVLRIDAIVDKSPVSDTATFYMTGDGELAFFTTPIDLRKPIPPPPLNAQIEQTQ